MSKKPSENDTWRFLKNSGVPLAIWATMLIYGTIFYTGNSKFQEDTLQFQDDSKRRFEEFTKYREKQSERDSSLLLEVKTMGTSMLALVDSMREMKDDQKELRGQQMKLNESLQNVKLMPR